MLYARSSVERVKALLEPDSTLAGKLAALVKEIYRQGKGVKGEAGELHLRLAHRLHRIRTFAPESLYRRYHREEADFNREVSPADKEAMERAEAELFIRLRKQLGVKRVGDWLDAQGGGERALSTRDLVRDESSFIRFIYSVLYADSRPAFRYEIEDTIGGDQEAGADSAQGASGVPAASAEDAAPHPAGASVRTGGYVAPDVLLRKKG
jgi:hypothetical protein